MREEFETREVWPFECLGCRHIWESEYTARHLTDGHGHGIAVWLRSGVPVQPPWVDADCPSCQGFNVATFPVGSRRPKPPSLRPVPAGGETIPVIADVVAEVKAVVRHGRRPSRTLVLSVLAVALLIFACYELYVLTMASQVH